MSGSTVGICLYASMLKAFRPGKRWITVDVDILRSASRAALVLDPKIVSKVAIQDPSRPTIGKILCIIGLVPRAVAMMPRIDILMIRGTSTAYIANAKNDLHLAL